MDVNFTLVAPVDAWLDELFDQCESEGEYRMLQDELRVRQRVSLDVRTADELVAETDAMLAEAGMEVS